MTEITVKEGRQTVTIDANAFFEQLKVYQFGKRSTEEIADCINKSTIPTTDEIKAGDYVTDETGVIIYVSSIVSEEVFAGLIIKLGNNIGKLFRVNDYSINWLKSSFRKFYGTITIKCS